MQILLSIIFVTALCDFVYTIVHHGPTVAYYQYLSPLVLAISMVIFHLGHAQYV